LQDLCLKEATRSLRMTQGSLGSEANLVGAVTLALQDI
jgi:glucokinase